VRDAERALAEIARVLELHDASDVPLAERVRVALRDRELLLLLDNMEQIVAAAPDVAELAIACPGLTVLVTSRELLRVRGEHEFPVPPLPVPEGAARALPIELAENASVALFVRQARSVRPEFALSAENAVAVCDICVRLEGLPLAIELAASRAKLLPPDMLLARLDRRLALLVHGARDLPARLQTMRDAIAWSHDLLAPHEQVLFRQLAIFAGGFTLEAAEAVCAAEAGNHDPGPPILDGLTSLVEKSLLREEERFGSSRFMMLETIREFAAEQLDFSGEGGATAHRHARWLLELAERAWPEIYGGASQRGLTWLDAERDNLRAALGWLIEQEEAETVQRLVFRTCWYWYVTGQAREGAMWAERASMLGPSPSGVRATALIAAGWLTNEYGDADVALPFIVEAISLLDTAPDPTTEAQAVMTLGLIAMNQGDLDRARSVFGDALTRHEALNNTNWSAYLLNNLGLTDYLQGDFDQADTHLSEALARFRAMDNVFGTAIALINLARLARRRGDLERAAELYAEGLSLRWADSDKISVASCLRGLAHTAVLARQYERGVRLFAAAEALRDAIGAGKSRTATRIEDALAPARATLGDAAFAATWAAGRALPLAEAVNEALAVPETLAGSHTVTNGEQPLTARELDVLLLLVAGRSNPEIADALFISRRTVTTHVTNLFAKLGVSNRVEATIAAQRRGLVRDDLPLPT
jgi:non-specific serine/threonine protein kinase